MSRRIPHEVLDSVAELEREGRIEHALVLLYAAEAGAADAPAQSYPRDRRPWPSRPFWGVW